MDALDRQNAIRQFYNDLNGTDIPMLERENKLKGSIVYNSSSYKKTTDRPNLYAYRIRTGEPFDPHLTNEEIRKKLR